MEETANNSSDTKATTKDSSHLRDFCENTTLHGARYLTDKTFYRRFVWFLLLSAGFGVCGYQIYNSLYAFFKRPISTVITTEIVGKLDFPAVTLCNINTINKHRYIAAVRQVSPSAANATDEKLERDIEEMMYLMSAPLNVTTKSEKLTRYFHNSSNYYTRGETLKYSLENYSHSIEGILSIEWLNPCEWRGQTCGTNNFSSFLNLRMGQCYTFNSGKPGHPRLQTNLVGPTNGLRLRLNVEEQSHVSNFYNLMTGFKVLIHSQNDYPLVEDFGFGLQPGSHTFCAIRKKKYINLPAPYRMKCSTNITDINKYFVVNYSIHTCNKQCIHNYGVKKCGCQPIYNITDGVPLCSLKDTFECIILKNLENFHDEVADCVIQYCPVPCNITKYETKLSYASAIGNAFARSIPIGNGGIPGKSFETFNNKTTQEKKEFFRESVATLDVYFEELSYDVIEQRPAVDNWALIGAIGGYLGLFLGMSVLTVLEFVDFLTVKLVKACRERNRVTGIAENQRKSNRT